MTQYIGEEDGRLASIVLRHSAAFDNERPEENQTVAKLVMEVRSLQARLDKLEGGQ